MQKFAVGQEASRKQLISSQDVADFARISGDTNPIHLDADFALRSRFGRTIVHGALGFGLISAVLGNDLPGNGTIYLGQSIRFLKPFFPDDQLEAVVKILAIDDSKGRLVLETKCYNSSKECVIDGEATVFHPDAKRQE